MKRSLIFLVIYFIINICHAQKHYELIDNRIAVEYNLSKLSKDSLIIHAKLLNITKQQIWITDNNFIFNPIIRGHVLYLNMGIDFDLNSPMDIVPFPLRKLNGGDSLTFDKIIQMNNFDIIQISCNYLVKDDYNKILKRKKTNDAISLLDYYKNMQSIVISTNIDNK